MISERGSVRRVVSESGSLKWKALLAILLLWVAFFTDQVWVFALLFVLWALQSVVAGETHFVELVRRDRNPVVFWVIVASWIAMSVLWVVFSV